MIKVKGSDGNIINDISDEIRPKPLKKGDQVVFRVLGVKLTKEGEPLIPEHYVPKNDVIWDKGKGKWVTIGLVGGVGINGKIRYFNAAFEKVNAGEIVCRGGNARDANLYEYLKLCNFNITNPDRDPDAYGIFEEVNAGRAAKKKLDSMERERMVLNYASETGIKELKALMVARGTNHEGLSDDEIRLWAVDWAKKAPEEFFRTETSNTKTMESTLGEALRRKIIQYNVSVGAYQWTESKDVIFEVRRSASKEEKIKEFAKWAVKHEDFATQIANEIA